MPDHSTPFTMHVADESSRLAGDDASGGPVMTSNWNDVLLAVEQMLDAEEAAVALSAAEKAERRR